MSRSWEVTVNGAVHIVNIEPTETGKDVIRVDGRTAARPLGANEAEREFAIAGQPYLLLRDGKNFSLVERDVAPAMPAAAYVPGRTADMPLPAAATDSKLGELRKLVWVVIVGIIGGMLYMATGPSYPKQAGKRVDQLLTEMKGGPGPQAQYAVGLWMKNVPKMTDQNELAWASDHFDAWCKEKDMYREIGDHKIISSEEVKGAEVPTAIVTAEIEGKTYKMRVPERKPISWEE